MGEGHDHYISRLHLRGFSGNGSHVSQLDLRSGATRPISIADAAVERGLNTLVIKGQRTRALESYLSQREDAVAPILDELRAAPTGPLTLSATDNGVLSNYMALAYTRGAHWRAALPERQLAAMTKMADEMADETAFVSRLASYGVAVGPEDIGRLREWAAALRRGAMPAEITPMTWELSIAVTSERPTQAFRLMSKFLVHRPGSPLMICGDCPVVPMRDNAYYAAADLGMTSEDVRVVMPISSESFVVATFATANRVRQLLEHWRTDAMASFVNRASIQHAVRFLFSRDKRELKVALKSFRRNPLAQSTATP